MKSYRVLTLMVALMLALSSCSFPTANPTATANPNAVFTAAAQTVAVQLTKNALQNPTNAPATTAPPTDTAPAVTDTPQPSTLASITPPGLVLATATAPVVVQPTTACDAAQFVADVSIPDGTSFHAGTSFTKTWRIKNTGTCTWKSSYTLVFDSGDQMGGPSSQGLGSSVGPGQSVEISVNLQAPSTNGTFRGYWGLKNASGARLPVAGGTNGKSFYVEIIVGSGSGSGTPTNSPGKFAVTSVVFSPARTGGCSDASGKYVVTATIYANKGGTVTYNWIRSDGATGPTMSGSLTFDNAGSQSISFEWTTTATGLWVDLYIDNPNHQQFGRANLNCP